MGFILRLRHNVTHKDVAKFSPILADRWAVSTSEGLEKIVHQIKRAIKLDEQKKDPLIMIGTINLLTHELTIDGKILSRDVYAYIKDGRTYIPVKYLALVLGVNEHNILWDEENQTMTLIKGNRVVNIKVGEKIIFINGHPVTMDIEPLNIDGQIMMSASYLSQALGGNVIFDNSTFTIVFTSYRQ